MRGVHWTMLLVASGLAILASCGSGSDSSGNGGPGPEPPWFDDNTADEPAGESPYKNDGDGGSGASGGVGGSGGAGAGGGPSGGAGGSSGQQDGSLGPPDGPASTGGSAGATEAGPPALPEECFAAPSTLRDVAGDANGMTSATRARERIHAGQAPFPKHVRREDFMNYYRIDLGAPTADEPLVVAAQLRARSVPGQYDLYVGVQAPVVAKRPRVVLTLLVDTTPSMAGIPLERAVKIVEALGESLQAGDRVNLVTTDPIQPAQSFTVADPVAELGALAQALVVGEQAELETAFGTAYQLAAADHDAAAWNRLLLISDGGGSADLLTTLPIKTAAVEKKIFLVAAGVGLPDLYRDQFLFRASRLGRGAYLYVDSPEEATSAFRDRFAELLGFSVDDVRVDVQLPSFVTELPPPPVDPMSAAATFDGDGAPTEQYLAPGGTMSFLHKVKTCVTDTSSLPAGSFQVTVSYVDPVKGVDDLSIGFPFQGLLSQGQTPALDKAVAVRSYVDALKSLNASRFQLAQADASLAAQSNPGDLQVTELQSLIEAHPAM